MLKVDKKPNMLFFLRTEKQNAKSRLIYKIKQNGVILKDPLAISRRPVVISM